MYLFFFFILNISLPDNVGSVGHIKVTMVVCGCGQPAIYGVCRDPPLIVGAITQHLSCHLSAYL